MSDSDTIDSINEAIALLETEELSQPLKDAIAILKEEDLVEEEKKALLECLTRNLLWLERERNDKDVRSMPTTLNSVHACLMSLVRALTAVVKEMAEESAEILESLLMLLSDATATVPADLLINCGVLYAKILCLTEKHHGGYIVKNPFYNSLPTLNKSAVLVASLGHDCEDCLKKTYDEEKSWLFYASPLIKKGLTDARLEQNSQDMIGWHRVLFHALKKLAAPNPMPEYWEAPAREACKSWKQELLDGLEATSDTVRHISRDCFPILLQVLSKIDQEQVEELVKAIQVMKPHRKGRYFILSCLPNVLEAGTILKLWETLPGELLAALYDAGVPFALMTSAYRSLFKRHAKDNAEEAVEIWIKPLLDSPDSKAEDLLGLLIDVEPKVVAQLFVGLNEPGLAIEMVENRLRVFLKCCLTLKLKNKPTPDAEKAVKLALTSSNEETRLLAFSVNCYSHKTTSHVTEEIVENFLTFFSGSRFCRESPIRQKLLAVVKKFFKWIKDSCASSRKTAKEREQQHQYVERMKRFFLGLLSAINEDLISGAHYASLVTGLSVLLLLEEQVGWISEPFGSLEARKELAQAYERLLPGLLDCLREPFEDVKTMALNVLSRLPSYEYDILGQLLATPFGEFGDSRIFLIDRCLNAFYDPEAKASLSAAFIIRVILSNKCDAALTLFVVNRVKQSLGENVATAEKDLISAAASSPMFGNLIAARHVLEVIPYVPAEVLTVFEEMLELSMAACRVALPVSASESPEGFFPEAAEKAEEEEEEDEAAFVAPRTILSCSWRTLKEASIFMSRAIQLHLKSLRPELVIEITDCLMDVLKVVKHRAAFEQVYASFKIICSCLWTSSVASFARQPEVCLNQMLDAIHFGHTDNLCVTRRGAGIPFIVQAVLTTEPTVKGGAALKKAMSILLPIAKNHEHAGLLHAMNILRALFCDSDLREPIGPFVEEGLQIAVENFASSNWALRNTASLMFAKLVTRVFGVKRDKNDGSTKNSVTFEGFAAHYPKLFDFIVMEMERSSPMVVEVDMDDVDKFRGSGSARSGSPKMLPTLLMILAKLRPALTTDAENNQTRWTLIDALSRCARLQELLVRKMVAKALVALLTPDEIPNVLASIFYKLPDSIYNDGTGAVHGMLLQAKSLLLSPNFDTARVPISAPTTWLGYLMSTMSDKNFVERCLLVRATALDIFTIFVSKGLVDGGGQMLVQELLMICDIVEAMAMDGVEIGVPEYRVSTTAFLLAVSLKLMKMPWAKFINSLSKLLDACEKRIEVVQVLVEFVRMLVTGSPTDEEKDIDCVLFQPGVWNVRPTDQEQQEIVGSSKEILMKFWRIADASSCKFLKSAVFDLSLAGIKLEVFAATDCEVFMEGAAACVIASSGYILQRSSLALAFNAALKIDDGQRLERLEGSITFTLMPGRDVELKKILSKFVARAAKLRPDAFQGVPILLDAVYLLLNEPEASVRRNACEAVFYLAKNRGDSLELPVCEIESLKILLSMVKNDCKVISWWFALGEDADRVDEVSSEGANVDDGLLNLSAHAQVLLETLRSRGINDLIGISFPKWTETSDNIAASLVDVLSRFVDSYMSLDPLKYFVEEELLLRRIYVLSGFLGVLDVVELGVDQQLSVVLKKWRDCKQAWSKTWLHLQIGDLLHRT